MRSALRAIAAGALLVAALARCESFSTESGASADAAAAPDAAASDSSPGIDAPVDASRCDSGCPGTAGPCAVKVGPTCIDATEVTVADYRAFTAATAGTSIDAGAPCGVLSIALLGVRASEALPMTEVTFCQARAFCQWAGKRLCGRVGGGTLDPGNLAGTQEGAWFNACSGGTSDNVHLLSDAACQLEADAVAPSGSTCQGGAPGLFDMVGNVWEWVDALDLDGAAPAASFMGGTYAHPRSTGCGARSGSGIDFAATDVGFRCCSP